MSTRSDAGSAAGSETRPRHARGYGDTGAAVRGKGAVAAAATPLAFSLMRRLLPLLGTSGSDVSVAGGDGGDAAALCPLAVHASLAAAYCGAERDSETARALATASRLRGGEEVDGWLEALAGARERLDAATLSADGVSARLSGAVFAPPALAGEAASGYQQLLQHKCGASLRPAAPGRDGAAAVNGWAQRHAELSTLLVSGRMPSRYADAAHDGRDPAAPQPLLLASALRVSLRWARAAGFDARATTRGSFASVSGVTESCAMMHARGAFQHIRCPKFSAVALPLGSAGDGGRFDAVVVVPDEGHGLHEVARPVLTAHAWASMCEGMAVKVGRVSLPRFEVDAAHRLGGADLLPGMGADRAFSRSEAELGAMGGRAHRAAGSRVAFVADVLHGVALAVDETSAAGGPAPVGTAGYRPHIDDGGLHDRTAAAAARGAGSGTQSVVASTRSGGDDGSSTATASAFHLRADRPFLFVVRDRLEGGVLLVAAVGSPGVLADGSSSRRRAGESGGRSAAAISAAEARARAERQADGHRGGGWGGTAALGDQRGGDHRDAGRGSALSVSTGYMSTPAVRSPGGPLTPEQTAAAGKMLHFEITSDSTGSDAGGRSARAGTAMSTGAGSHMAEAWGVGTTVEVSFGGFSRGRAHRATISRVNPDGTYDVRWVADGEEHRFVSRAWMRGVDTVGTRPEVRQVRDDLSGVSSITDPRTMSLVSDATPYGTVATGASGRSRASAASRSGGGMGGSSADDRSAYARSAVAPPLSVASHGILEGDSVLVRYGGAGKRVRGEVVAVRPDGTLDVKHDDSGRDVEANVPLDWVTPAPSDVPRSISGRAGSVSGAEQQSVSGVTWSTGGGSPRMRGHRGAASSATRRSGNGSRGGRSTLRKGDEVRVLESERGAEFVAVVRAVDEAGLVHLAYATGGNVPGAFQPHQVAPLGTRARSSSSGADDAAGRRTDFRSARARRSEADAASVYSRNTLPPARRPATSATASGAGRPPLSSSGGERHPRSRPTSSHGSSGARSPTSARMARSPTSARMARSPTAGATVRSHHRVNPWHPDKEARVATAGARDAATSLAMSVLRRLLPSSENATVFPLGVHAMLCAAWCGATEATAAALVETARLKADEAREWPHAISALMRQLDAAQRSAHGLELECGVAAFWPKGRVGVLSDTYRQAAQRGARVEFIDVATAAATDGGARAREVDEWMAGCAGGHLEADGSARPPSLGRMPSVFTERAGDDVAPMLLASSLRLRGWWAPDVEFSASTTSRDVFHTDHGGSNACYLMHATFDALHVRCPKFQAVRLPLGPGGAEGARYCVVVVLPNEDVTVDDIAKPVLAAPNWRTMRDGMAPKRTRVALPRTSVAVAHRLGATLHDMGCRDPMSQSRARFDRMGGRAAQASRSRVGFVADAVQAVSFYVDESGLDVGSGASEYSGFGSRFGAETTPALRGRHAVHSLPGGRGSPEPEAARVVCTRPFLLAVCDDADGGAPVLLARVGQPGTPGRAPGSRRYVTGDGRGRSTHGGASVAGSSASAVSGVTSASRVTQGTLGSADSRAPSAVGGGWGGAGAVNGAEASVLGDWRGTRTGVGRAEPLAAVDGRPSVGAGADSVVSGYLAPGPAVLPRAGELRTLRPPASVANTMKDALQWPGEDKGVGAGGAPLPLVDDGRSLTVHRESLAAGTNTFESWGVGMTVEVSFGGFSRGVAHRATITNINPDGTCDVKFVEDGREAKFVSRAWMRAVPSGGTHPGQSLGSIGSQSLRSVATPFGTVAPGGPASLAAGSMAMSDAVDLERGDAIEVNYGGRGTWMRGKVAFVHPNGTLDIQHDDAGKDVEENVPLDWVRRAADPVPHSIGPSSRGSTGAATDSGRSSRSRRRRKQLQSLAPSASAPHVGGEAAAGPRLGAAPLGAAQDDLLRFSPGDVVMVRAAGHEAADDGAGEPAGYVAVVKAVRRVGGKTVLDVAYGSGGDGEAGVSLNRVSKQ